MHMFALIAFSVFFLYCVFSLSPLAALMEVFQLLETREIKLNQVFSNSASTICCSDDISSLLKKFVFLFENKIKGWWDITLFEQYIHGKLVPRRLRWDIPPSDGLSDEESLQEWYDFFNMKGIELVDLLLKRKQRKMKNLEHQIFDIKTKMELHKNHSEFSKLSIELKNKLIKWDNDAQNKKKGKFIRDSGDF